MSELISGSELAQRTGFSNPTIMKYVTAGKIPYEEDENGRRRFDLSKAQAAIDAMGLKPRARNTKSADATEEATQAVVEDEAAAPSDTIVNALNEAFKAADQVFRATLRTHIDLAAEQEDADSELTLLRLYAKSDDVFETVSAELTGGQTEGEADED